MSSNWDDTFDTGDELTAAEWNEHVQDQKNRIVDEDGSVNAENVDFTSIDGAGNIVIGNDDVIISVLNVSEKFGLPTYENEEDAPDDTLFVLDGEGLRFKDDTGSTSNAGGIDVLDNGSLVLTADGLNFGDDLDVTDNEDGTGTIELSSSVSADISISDDGTEVLQSDELDFGENLNVTDDAGVARIDLAGDLSVAIEDDEVAVADATTVNFGEGLDAEDAGSGTVNVDFSGITVEDSGDEVDTTMVLDFFEELDVTVEEGKMVISVAQDFDFVYAEAFSDLDSPSEIDKPTIAYTKEEDDYLGVFQE